MNEIIDCLIKGVKPGEKYPPSVRAFCLSLNYTSPKGYSYVRNKFGKNLPHPETLREWYRNSDLDAKSGISHKSMEALEKKAKQMKEDGQQMVVGILLDEMAIQQNITWCRATNKFIGLSDCGQFVADEEFTVAKNVIVFMASGLNVHVQQPIAFYFITTIKAKDRAELIVQIVADLFKRDLIVASITFDGYSSNAQMCQILGADLKNKDLEYRTYFTYNGNRIYFFYDPSHMEKLVRNILASLGVIYVGQEKVEWKYFIELVDFSQKKNLGLAHKINKRHIEWADRKMHVRTAVETLSRSTAESMDFLMKKGVPQFTGATETINFIKIHDSLWDVMNSRRIKHNASNIYQSALNPANKNEVFVFLHKAKEYILSMEVKDPKTNRLVLLVKSIWKTGFRGFITDIISLIAIYEELVEKHHWLMFFATYRISQDHLEMFFGKIRSMNGNSDNPMAHQFVSAYRKLQLQCDISVSAFSNVTSLVTSNVLTISSFKNPRPILGTEVNAYRNEPVGDVQPLLTSSLDESIEFSEWEQHMAGEYLTDRLQDPGIVYAANLIERKLRTCEQVYCQWCIKVLENNEKVDNGMTIDIGRGIPCVSTYQLCKLTDTAIKIYINTDPKFKQKIYNHIFELLDWVKIFPQFYDNHHDSDHKQFLVKFIVDEFINKKCAYIAKHTNLELHKKYLRNKLRKLCHYLHQ